MNEQLVKTLEAAKAKILWIRRVRSVNDPIEIHVLAHNVGNQIIVLEVPDETYRDLTWDSTGNIVPVDPFSDEGARP